MEIGIKGIASVTVDETNTAMKVGSGLLPVYSTPSMIALLEMAACNCVADYLEEGTSSVGTLINIKHLAATPIGMNVTATATLTSIEGRKLTFEIEVVDECTVIGSGTHERFIVYSEKFLSKTNEKLTNK